VTPTNAALSGTPRPRHARDGGVDRYASGGGAGAPARQGLASARSEEESHNGARSSPAGSRALRDLAAGRKVMSAPVER